VGCRASTGHHQRAGGERDSDDDVGLVEFREGVFLAFDEARRFFPEKKVYVIGNPIRRKLLDKLPALLDASREVHRARLRRFAGGEGPQLPSSRRSPAPRRL